MLRKAVLSRAFLKFDQKKMLSMAGKVSAEGGDTEGKPDDTPNRYSPAKRAVAVLDGNGDVIPKSSEALIDFFDNSSATIYLYGNSSYSDPFGKYRRTFCQTIFIMQVNTSRKPLHPTQNASSTTEKMLTAHMLQRCCHQRLTGMMRFRRSTARPQAINRQI